jgi:hypothetical protein
MRLTDALGGASDHVTTTTVIHHDELEALSGWRLSIEAGLIRGVACVRDRVDDRENEKEVMTSRDKATTQPAMTLPMTTTFIHCSWRCLMDDGFTIAQDTK